MNSQPENRNFAYSCRPIYCIPRVDSLLSFRITYDSFGVAKSTHTSLFDGFWFEFSIGIYLLAAYREYEQISNSQKSLILSVIYFIFFFSIVT